MAEIHHFTYGWFNPLVAFVLAFLGSLLGLICTTRSRHARTRRRRARWLVIATVSIGGGGIWLMHFMAMLGMEVPDSALRYEPIRTIGSLALAVGPVGMGLFLVAGGRRTTPRLLWAGLLTGLGVLAMHYGGMSAVRVAGTVTYDPGLVGASAIIAVVAATAALWFATSVTRLAPTALAALIMAVAVCGMHYTGMAAVRVDLSAEPVDVPGISPFLLIVPITVVTALALIGTAVSALQAMTEEEFDGAVTGRHRGGAGPAGPMGTAFAAAVPVSPLPVSPLPVSPGPQTSPTILQLEVG